jgi:DNA-binding transcriptional MerR regulator
MKLTTRKGLHIGQLAKLAGVRPDTVRFYEHDGLLARPERSAAGYRIYDEAALKRLRFIKQAQALGFSLERKTRRRFAHPGSTTAASALSWSSARHETSAIL